MINKKDFLAYKMDFNERVLKPLFSKVGEYVTISDEAVEDSELPSNRGILIDLFYEKGQDTGIISQDYYEYALISFPGQGNDKTVGVHELVDDDAVKKEQITELLIDIFDRIDIQTPGNFDSILNYVYEDICKRCGNNWNEGDVRNGFRNWINNN